MATLEDFITNNIPLKLRHTRDFTTGRGWIALTNKLLKRLQRRGLFDLTQMVETGVEVSNKYWITFPSDAVEIVEIYFPPLLEYSEKDRKYPFEIINGKIKLTVPFDIDADPDTFVLSAGSTTGITINDDDATEDQYENYLLVPTNGTYQTPLIISGNDAASGGTADLDFMHTQDNAIDSTAGYLTSQYLMVQYRKRYTGLSLSTDEIPLNAEYEDILTWGLCMLATEHSDEKVRQSYKIEFYEAIEEYEALHNTPSPDQARPQARSMPGLENADAYDRYKFDYIGED